MVNRRYNQHRTDPKDYQRAQQLRREASHIEQKFWFALRQAAAVSNLKFRRQQPIHPYIADFACMKAKLLIELDGPSHDVREKYDQKRDIYLKNQGYTIIRIPNDEATHNLLPMIEMVLARTQELINLAPSPAKTKALPMQSQVFASSPSRGEDSHATDPRIDFEARDT